MEKSSKREPARTSLMVASESLLLLSPCRHILVVNVAESILGGASRPLQALSIALSGQPLLIGVQSGGGSPSALVHSLEANIMKGFEGTVFLRDYSVDRSMNTIYTLSHKCVKSESCRSEGHAKIFPLANHTSDVNLSLE